MSELKILIVEDEILVATDIEESLESLGYKVQNSVATGKAALEEVERNLPDIILMDIILKGKMTGIEAANIIGQKHNVPIIYLTANADISTIQKAKISLPYGYIIKPFTEKDLQTNIEIARYKFESDIKSKMESDRFHEFFARKKTEEIFIQGEKGLEKIKHDDIYYLESDGMETILYLADDTLKSDKPIDEFENILPTDIFIRVNDNFIVSNKKIFLAKFPEIIIADKMVVIPVDEDRKEKVEAMLGK